MNRLIAAAITLSFTGHALAADWQNCAFALGSVRSELAGPQNEAETLVMLDRENERSKRDYENCRLTGRDANRDSCERYKQKYDSEQLSIESHRNALRLSLTMLNQALSKVSLLCGSDVRISVPAQAAQPKR